MSILPINKLKYPKGKDKLNEVCNIISYINIERKEKHFRGKCAEVFIENGKYFINCYFCGKNAQNMEKLILHIYQEHFKLNVSGNWEQDEDEHQIIKNMETVTDADKIVIKSEFNLENKFDISVKATDMNETNEVCSEEMNNIVNLANGPEIYDVNNIDIPNKPIQYIDKNGEYPCSFCTRSFKKSVELQKHFITHSSTSDIKKIDNRKDGFYDNNKNNLQTQNIIGRRHEDGTFHCEICGRKYVKHYTYRAHFMETHQPDLNPYKCPDCPLTYTLRHRLEMHRRTHTGEKPHKCPHCPRAFALSTNLTRHVYIHLGKKPYICRYCGKAFTQQNSQKSHERNIHTKERPHQCELCGKSFARLFLLKEHWKRHTNTRPFQCHICFKRYFDNAGLKTHVNTHTGEKTYDCKLCSKKFRAINTLKAHSKLHLDTKQYQCKMCDKAFAQFAGLHGHMKAYHKAISKENKINLC